MNINRSNYEAYFIDYMDGQLADALVDELLDFLKENPDLAEELQAVSSIKLEAPSMTFSAKDSLLKQQHDEIDEADLKAIAYLEGDLDEAEKEQYVREIADEEGAIARLQVFKQTKLQADLNIVYPAKNELHRKNKKVILLWATRVAAMLLLFLTTYALVQQLSEPDESPVTIAEQTAVSKEPQETEKIAPKPDEPLPVEQVKQAQLAELPKEKKASPVKTPKVTESVAVTEELIPETPVRDPIPEEIEPMKPVISRQPLMAKATMKQETVIASTGTTSLSVDEFLAYKLINAPKGESFTIHNLANASLKAAENISNDRFDVQRSDNGRVEQIKFESRLVAFSIPFKKRR